MSDKRKVAGFAVVAALCLILSSAWRTNALPQAPTAGGQDTGQSKQPYTMPEYNSEQECTKEKNPAAQVKCLDDFVSKYPNSNLLIYVYPMYMQDYEQLKDYRKLIQTTEKLVGLSDKVDAATRFNAYYAHSVAYSTIIGSDKQAAQDQALARSAQDAVVNGLKTLDEVKKPDNVTDEAWANQTKQFQQFRFTMNSIGAQAAMLQKEYQAAIGFYKGALAINPDEPITNYNLGKAYLSLTPPQSMDGFWYVARGAASKSATQTQAKQLKEYLRKLIVNNQQAACDNLTDAELNEILQLAAGSAERPASYNIPSSADLDAARKDMTILSVTNDLKAGGDKAKVTWLAACGLEFPGVQVKFLEAVAGDPILLKVAFVTSEAEFDAATKPNMDVKIVGQPEAAKLEKDSVIHFTATLTSYDPDPAFMLHWDKGKVSDEDIPKEKAPPKRPARRPTPTKKPGR